MIKTFKLTAAALVAGMMLGGAAEAATSLDRNQTTSETKILMKSAGVDSFTFDFVANEALKLTGLSIAATGGSGGADVSKLIADFFINGVFVASNDFAPITVLGSSSFGGAGFTPPSYNLSAGDTFSFTVSEDTGNIASNVGLTSTVVTAPVPVPAAGVLMLSLMAAGGFAARRRNRKVEAA